VGGGFAEELIEKAPGLSPGGATAFVLGSGVDPSTFPEGLGAYRHQVHPGIENIQLEGNADHDVVADGTGNTIGGNAGLNSLYAGDGADTVHGGGGDDHLFGEGGSDRLFGDDGADWLDGGLGDDWLNGGFGDDWLSGGAGDDTFLLGLEGNDSVFDHDGSNTLRLEGGDPAKLTAALEGSDLILNYDGQQLAAVRDWVGHEGSIAGIDFGSGSRPIDDFLAPPGAAEAPAGDWLADYLVIPAEPSGGQGQGGGLAEAPSGFQAADGAPPLPAWIPGPLDHGFPAESYEADDTRHTQDKG
jgi:Ca2+-binding RTX toxin-like protein